MTWSQVRLVMYAREMVYLEQQAKAAEAAHQSERAEELWRQRRYIQFKRSTALREQLRWLPHENT